MARRNSLPVDEPFDYERLIDMDESQLADIIKECEINIERTRGEIIKNYQQAQPYLTRMRSLKNSLTKTIQKMEACKTFLSMEKNGSLVSNIDLSEMKKHFKKPEKQSDEERNGEETYREESPPPAPRKEVKKVEKTKFKTGGVVKTPKREEKTPISRSKTVPNLRKK
jgi:hypothetical protein